MAKKYYAVRKGRKTGIFEKWDECRAQVTGFASAEFKGFESLLEAQDFLQGDGLALEKETGTKTGESSSMIKAAACECEATAYVDGSFDITTGRFSYGCVIFIGDEEVRLSEAFSDKDLAAMRNVAGEIAGSMAAMRYCVEHDIKSVGIYHDYEGIAKWCTGEWKANKPGTIKYAEYYTQVSEKLKVEFHKVKGHSGDKYNDLVDMLAKQVLGIN